MPIDLYSMKNVLTPLAKSVLILFGLTAAASARDAAIQKKLFGSVHPSDLAREARVPDCLRPRTLVLSNEELNDVMRIIKSRQRS